MNLLHLFIGVLLMVMEAQTCSFCGCIYPDITDLAEEDYVCEPIRSEDFQRFLSRMYSALWYQWNAYTYIYSLPRRYEPPVEPGNPRCRTDFKQILGYYKNRGQILCYVVYPHLQIIKKAECSGEQCCGDNTRCELGGYVLTKYLVYCDALYTDRDGCLYGATELSESQPSGIDESEFIGNEAFRRKRDADEDISNSTLPGIQKREGCSSSPYYFAYRHEYLPSVCTCRKCSC